MVSAINHVKYGLTRESNDWMKSKVPMGTSLQAWNISLKISEA